MLLRSIATLGVTVLLAAGCSGDDSTQESTTTIAGGPGSDCSRVEGPPPIIAPLGAGRPDAAATLTPTGVSVDTPTALIALPGTDDLLVTERKGTVRRMAATADGFVLDPTAVLDISEDVRSVAGEHGLLGLAVAPAGDRLYVDYTEGAQGDIVVASFAMADGVVDTNDRIELLRMPPRCDAHLGGHLLFDDDGNLLVGVGDGDGGRIEVPAGASQDETNLFGSILRITPTPDGPDAYAIPAGNPFAEGDEGARGEILVQGVRNPWRFDLDPTTGALWVADVGEDAFEELTMIEASAIAGANLGWDHKEGSRPFRNVDSTPDDLIDPHYEYDRDTGCSITGGVVVTDAGLPGYGGGFVFGDLCTGAIRIALPADDGVTIEDLGVALPAVVTFAQDERNRVYAVSLTGAVFRLDVAG